MARRKLFPLPVEGIVDHPEFIALPAAGRGMLMTLVLYYWLTDCAPLPTKGSELFAVVRAAPSTWAHHQKTIFRVFEEIRPELDAYFRYRTNIKAALQDSGAKGRGIQRLKALSRKSHRNETIGLVNVQELAEDRPRSSESGERGARKGFSAGR